MGRDRNRSLVFYREGYPYLLQAKQAQSSPSLFVDLFRKQ